jgi:hypothetical protein
LIFVSNSEYFLSTLYIIDHNKLPKAFLSFLKKFNALPTMLPLLAQQNLNMET